MAISFSLVPFEPIVDIEIAGRVVRSQSSLTIDYRLTGAVENLSLPAARGDSPQRCDELWQDTCFEAFIGLQNTLPYWEINVTPSGDWNVYRFANYRQAMTPELACNTVSSTWQAIPKGYCKTLELPTADWLPSHPPMVLGISTILKTGSLSHWALVHPGTAPDFHRRDGFTLRLEA